MTSKQRDETESKERLISFATYLSLGEALESISTHEQAYNDHYLLAVNFRLLCVSEIDDLTNQQLDMVRVQLVENLNLKYEDFE